MVNGSPVSQRDVMKEIQRSGNNKEALVQALVLQALAEDLSIEEKQPRGRARIAQNSGPVTIEDCGTPGQIVNSVLQAALFWVPKHSKGDGQLWNRWRLHTSESRSANRHSPG